MQKDLTYAEAPLLNICGLSVTGVAGVSAHLSGTAAARPSSTAPADPGSEEGTDI